MFQYFLIEDLWVVQTVLGTIRRHGKQSAKGDLYACDLRRSESLKQRFLAMSIPDIATSLTVLDEWKTPWSATTLIETQQHPRSDVAKAKRPWTAALQELRDS